MESTKKSNPVLEKSYRFSLTIIDVYKSLVKEKEFVLSKQLLRSGTSIGANIVEAQAAISRKDFVAKMSIASKEARETHYWLSLLTDSNLSKQTFEKEMQDVDELISLLTSIVKTGQNR